MSRRSAFYQSICQVADAEATRNVKPAALDKDLKVALHPDQHTDPKVKARAEKALQSLGEYFGKIHPAA